jgi:hypothetical protein
VVVRILTLLVAVVMMAGAASPVEVPAADDFAGAVDAAPDVPVTPAAIAVAQPPRSVVATADEPSSHSGRFHDVTVFRPPRSFASR